MIAFSCIAQVIAMDGEPSAPKDPFAGLREELHARRMNADNALYADKMVEGSKAIEVVNNEKMEKLEKERQDKRRKISSASWYLFWSRPEMNSWFYAENEDTVVYKADEELNKKSAEDKEYYTKLANVYKGFADFLHNDVNVYVKSNLGVQDRLFQTMCTALDKCKQDNKCYANYHPKLSYEKIKDQNFRNKHKDKALKSGLQLAHSKDIPVTFDELKKIMKKNLEIVALYENIEKNDASIEDLTNPEKIKAREQKKIQDLEEQKKREEEAKRQAPEEELKQKNAQQ